MTSAVGVSATVSVRGCSRARRFQVVKAVTQTTLQEMANRYYKSDRPAVPRKVLGKSNQGWLVCTWSSTADRNCKLVLSDEDAAEPAYLPPTAVRWITAADHRDQTPAVLEDIICE
ncbi:hypothetical protein COCOBI_04-2170 [Coccomyxa sp. Obi]|nr:hypothetical protein COCOBI_04-2170 [Coccomyxa sp. Obi]